MIDALTNITFAWWWAVFALPLPLLIYALKRPAGGQPSAGLLAPFYRDLFTAQTQPRTTNRLGRALAMILIWAALVIAAMRPQAPIETVEVPLSGRDLMLAVDLSMSMGEPDFVLEGRPVTRLELVKTVAADFIARRVGDRVGLILFGQQPYLQTPLTTDRETVAQMLTEAELGLAGKATALGDAIGLAIKRFQRLGQSDRVLVLLTDGRNTTGALSPKRAAQLAARESLKIYTIGLGGNLQRRRGVISQLRARGNDLDEPTLKYIARLTGGLYFRANHASSLEQIYQELDQLEPVERDGAYSRPMSELYWAPLTLALCGSVLLALVIGGRAPKTRWAGAEQALEEAA